MNSSDSAGQAARPLFATPHHPTPWIIAQQRTGDNPTKQIEIARTFQYYAITVPKSYNSFRTCLCRRILFEEVTLWLIPVQVQKFDGRSTR